MGIGNVLETSENEFTNVFSFSAYLNIYDIERCVCDIIRLKSRMDLEHMKCSVKEYLKKDKDLTRLIKYTNIIGIKDEVMKYISLMYDIKYI